MILKKTAAEIEEMAKAGQIVARALELAKELIVPGLQTALLDKKIENLIRGFGAIPAFKGYRGFPATICISLNEQVVHGIPGARLILDGDIASIDVGVKLGDFFADAAITVAVGDCPDEAGRLLAATENALAKGICKCWPDNRLSDISHEIQAVAEGDGFSVVRDFVGHGIGRALHEEPQIVNYGPPGHGPRLEPGIVLAIEPMVNAGTHEVVVLPDGWTVVTKDNRLSAHFEHTVAITEQGPVILTKL